MKIAKVVNNQVVEYPYALRPNAKYDHPEVSPLPFNWEECKSLGMLESLSAVEVKPSIPPEFDPATQDLVELSPVYLDGEWTEVYEVVTRPIYVPQQVEAHKFRMVLSATGLRSIVEDFVAAADQNVKDAWEYVPFVSRSSLLLNAAKEQLELSNAQVDELFIAAHRIQT